MVVSGGRLANARDVCLSILPIISKTAFWLRRCRCARRVNEGVPFGARINSGPAEHHPITAYDLIVSRIWNSTPSNQYFVADCSMSCRYAIGEALGRPDSKLAD